MRSITDAHGVRWDVEIGRESYGIQLLLFFPAGGGGVRKALLSAETRLEAERELEGLSEAELLERLAGSDPWEAPTSG